MPTGTSLLLIDGESGLTRPVTACLAKHKQVRIHVLSSNPDDPIRYSRRVTSWHHHSSSREDELETKVRETIRLTGAELLVAVSREGAGFLIRRGSRIPSVRVMHLPSPQSFRTASDKWAFHLAAEACGAHSPRTWRAGDRSSLQDAVFPLLLKPRIGTGGNGILRIDPLRQTLDNCPPGFIIQEFIEGRDMGCSVFCREGRILACAIQEGMKAGKREFAPPAAVRFVEHDGALAEVRKMVESLNWNGVANFDMRVRNSDGKVFLLEANPRFWASIYGSLRAGVDFVGLNCSLVAPRSDASARPLHYYQGVRSLVPWLQGAASDLGYRLRDPLPDLMRKIAGLRQHRSPATDRGLPAANA